MGVAIAAAAMGVFAAPAAQASTRIAPSGSLHAVAITRSSVAPADSPVSEPLRVENPAQYAREKAAANAAYRAWARSHASVFGPGLSGTLTIPSLTEPGLGAAVSGGGTPPDPTGAIGPSYYFEFVNSEVAVYNRSTLGSPPVAAAPEDTFVGSSGTCDGQIKWDNFARRYEYFSLDCAASAGNEGFSLGWSKTASPLPLATNWCKYHFSTGDDLEDYGKLGNSNSDLILGANEFDVTSHQYLDSPIIVFPKPANGTTTCPAIGGPIFRPTPTGTDSSPEPANVFGSSAQGFVVATQDSTHLHMYTVTGAPPTAVLTDNGSILVPLYTVPASVPQPGTSDPIDSGDARLTQAVAAFDPGLATFGVWTQHTIGGSQGGPAVVRWYELEGGVTQSAPVQAGIVAPSNGLFAFNGAISPIGLGDAAVIDYNVGSSTVKVQVRARERLAGGSPGTTTNETSLGSSPAIDADFSCPSVSGKSGPCRWGDYAAASPDPNCLGNVWGTNELNGPTQAAHGTSWATQNFRLTVVPCPTAAFTFSAPSSAHGSPVTFDASGSSPGAGTITSYAWNFGDGVKSTVTTSSVDHTYNAAGIYNVVLTVKNSAGTTGTVSHQVFQS